MFEFIINFFKRPEDKRWYYFPLSAEYINVPIDHPYVESVSYHSEILGHARLSLDGPDLKTFWDQDGILCIENTDGQIHRIVYG